MVATWGEDSVELSIPPLFHAVLLYVYIYLGEGRIILYQNYAGNAKHQHPLWPPPGGRSISSIYGL